MSTEHGKRSFENKENVLVSEKCGCYYCCQIYESKLVDEYCKDTNGYTAICPKCGIDSVIAFEEKIDKDLFSFKRYLEKCREISFAPLKE